MHSPTTSAGRGPLMAAVATAVLLALTLTGCSVRFDTPPDPIPSPDAAESLRAELAEQTETLITLAGAAQSDDQDVATELAAIATASEAQLAALGGIWTPPPRPDDASPTPTPEPTATPQEVLATLTEAATDVQQAVGAPVWDGDGATLLASMAVYRDAALSRLAGALGVQGPEVPEPSEDLPAQLGPASAGLCRTLDGLGYALEVQAARSDGEQQDRAERRAARDRALAEQIAVLAGYDGTEDDPRQASYAVGEDLQETIETWQAQLVPAWLALVGPAAAEDRPLLLSHARAAAARASVPIDEAFPGLQPA